MLTGCVLGVVLGVLFSIRNLREALRAYREARAAIRRAKAAGRARAGRERALTREVRSWLSGTGAEG